jgi:hypothetical protein
MISDVGIFRMPDPANPQSVQAAALLAGTYWFAMPVSLAPVYNLPTNCTTLSKGTPCAQPAHPGDQCVCNPVVDEFLIGRCEHWVRAQGWPQHHKWCREAHLGIEKRGRAAGCGDVGGSAAGAFAVAHARRLFTNTTKD